MTLKSMGVIGSAGRNNKLLTCSRITSATADISAKLLKRINLRNSYKVSFLNKSKLVHLDIFKYKISLN